MIDVRSSLVAELRRIAREACGNPEEQEHRVNFHPTTGHWSGFAVWAMGGRDRDETVPLTSVTVTGCVDAEHARAALLGRVLERTEDIREAATVARISNAPTLRALAPVAL